MEGTPVAEGSRRGAARAVRRWLTLTLIVGLMLAALPVSPTRAATIQVTNKADSGTGSLRQAIADAASGDTITFAPAVTGTITLESEVGIGEKTLTIAGPGADRLTIDGNRKGRVFSVGRGNVTFNDLTISNGLVTGIGFSASALLVTNGSVTLNRVAVTNHRDSSYTILVTNSGSLTIKNSLIANNHNSGPGSYVLVVSNYGILTVANSTISGNTSNDYTIMAANYANFTMTNATVANNTVGNSWGATFRNQNDATTTLANTIIADNSSSANCSVPIIDAGHNLDDDNSCGFTGDGSIVNRPARLGPLADNGGPTRTHALLVGSPAIDAGDPALCAAATVGAVDQRGIARPQGVACDIGALELDAHSAPALYGINPATGRIVGAGSPDLEITVSGENFAAGGFATAHLGSTPLDTTFVSASQLTARIPASLRAVAGDYPITVTNGPPGGGTSAARILSLTNAVPALTALAPTGVTTGSDATSLVITGDGFAPDATVGFGDTTLIPTSITSGTIAVNLPAVLLTTPRTVAVAVTNPAPGGGTSIPLTFAVNSPTPAITGLNPSTVTAGATDLALTIDGSNFVAGSVLEFGGQRLDTTLGSATRLTATIPAAALRVAGPITVRVLPPAPGGGPSAGATFIVNPAGAAQLAIGSGNSRSAAVGTAFSGALSVVVRDQYGNPVAAGTIVTFAAPAGGAGGTFPGGAITATVPTDSNGVATAPAFTANGTAGTYSVIASAGAGAVPFTHTNTPGPAARFDATAPATATAGTPVPVTVTVRDAAGNLVPTYTGTVHFSSDDARAILPADTAFGAGNNGTKTFVATLATAGARTLSATDTVATGITGAAPVAVVHAAPATLAAVDGTPQSRTIGETFASLTAIARDAYGNPSPGVAVTFAAPVGGAGGTFPAGGVAVTVATDRTGVATAPAFVANNTVGTYMVVASSIAGNTTFTLTNTARPVATVGVAVTTGDGGTVSPGSGNYPLGSTVAFNATPDEAHLFLGWTVDGQFVGLATPLNLPITGARTVEARFAPRHTFADVAAGGPAAEAIAQLAARGIVNGYGDGRFGPTDQTLRAQSAALLVRAMGWSGEAHGNPFPDQCEPLGRNCVDGELWNAVGILSFYNVARGYDSAATCGAAGTVAPCYLPRDPVAHIQAISFITRAMVARGYWTQATADDPSIHPNIAATSGHRLDLVTYVRNAGAVPGQARSGDFGGYDQPATRAFFAEALWQAYSAYFGHESHPVRAGNCGGADHGDRPRHIAPTALTPASCWRGARRALPTARRPRRGAGGSSSRRSPRSD